MGKRDDAENYYHRFLNGRPINWRAVARCYRGLGSIAYKKRDYDSSLKWHHKSLEIKMRILEPDYVEIASGHGSIGHVYKEKKEYAHALESFEKALTIYKQAFGEDHTSVATCIENIGTVYYNAQKYSETLELYQRVLSIREKHLPAGHEHLGVSHYIEHWCYSSASRSL
jgi:tetratricopeptide (TPR) repeat protein